MTEGTNEDESIEKKMSFLKGSFLKKGESGTNSPQKLSNEGTAKARKQGEQQSIDTLMLSVSQPAIPENPGPSDYFQFEKIRRS